VFVSILGILAKVVEAHASVVDVGSHVTEAVAISRSAEVCGEAMKVVIAALTTRRDVAVNRSQASSQETTRACTQLVEGGCKFLRSELVHKDIMTQIAMGCLAIQRLFRIADDGRDVELEQFDALVTALMAAGNGAAPSSSPLLPPLQDALAGLHTQAWLSTLRAIVTVTSDSILSATNSNQVPRAFAELLDAVLRSCDHPLPLYRVYGLQILEAWLMRVVGVTTAIAQSETPLLGWREAIQGSVDRITASLNLCWSHPSKRVSQMVPVVYGLLLDWHEAALALSAKPASPADWAFLVNEAIRQPSRLRSKYSALTRLLPKVGAEFLAELYPNLVQGLVDALECRDVAAAVSATLVEYLGGLVSANEKRITDAAAFETYLFGLVRCVLVPPCFCLACVISYSS
jgi:hypothetical protein